MEMSTSTNQPQTSTYTYKPVARVEYPPLASPFEVSPTPDPAAGSSTGLGRNGSDRLTQLSYGTAADPRSYMPFQSTMEPDLPEYSADNAKEQPAPTTQRTAANVVNTPPEPTPPPTTTINNVYTEEWRYTLFDCFSYSHTCLGVMCCAPCIFGRTSSMLRQHKNHCNHNTGLQMKKDDLKTSEYTNSTCMLFSACTVLTAGIGACLYNFSTRSTIRQTYRIQGEDLDDGCVSCCCLCCAIGQQDMEVKSRILNQS